MNKFARAAVQPMLREFRKAVAELRQAGATDEDVTNVLAAAVVEICRQVDDAEDREWLAREFSAAAGRPRLVHEGTGTVQ
jgi:hypothetical protein